MATAETEYGGADGMFGNVDRGAPPTPYLALLAYRRSAGQTIRTDANGVAIPETPLYGTSQRA